MWFLSLIDRMYYTDAGLRISWEVFSPLLGRVCEKLVLIFKMFLELTEAIWAQTFVDSLLFLWTVF